MCRSAERNAGPTAFDKLHDKLGDRFYYSTGTVDRPCGEDRTSKRFQVRPWPLLRAVILLCACLECVCSPPAQAAASEAGARVLQRRS